jgi:hypothetical protein
MDKKSIQVDYEIKDGRLFINMLYPENQKTPYVELVSVLVASLSMTVRTAKEKGYNEGEIFGHVMKLLESEFVNPDSFNDLKVYR